MVMVIGEIKRKITIAEVEIRKICIALMAIEIRINPKIKVATKITTPRALLKNPAIIIKKIFGTEISPPKPKALIILQSRTSQILRYSLPAGYDCFV